MSKDDNEDINDVDDGDDDVDDEDSDDVKEPVEASSQGSFPGSRNSSSNQCGVFTVRTINTYIGARDTQ